LTYDANVILQQQMDPHQHQFGHLTL
jgi:hypothetical protein